MHDIPEIKSTSGQGQAAWPYDFLYSRRDYSEYLPDFAAKQQASARALVDHLFPKDVNAPYRIAVDRIIDVGCGDGSILGAIVGILQERNQKVPAILGLDRSEHGIARAQSLAIPTAKFIAVEDEADLRAHLAKELENNSATTAVTVVGHTWFHFLEQDALVEVIGRGRPAVLVVDFHDEWDRDIARLSQADSRGHVDTLLSIEAGYVRSLRTEIRDEFTVRRGLAHVPFNGAQATWMMETAQANLASSYLVGSASQREKLKTARSMGTLLGGCDYFVNSSFQHDSGWGRMTGYMLLRLDKSANAVNDAWADTIRDAIRKLFLTRDPSYDRIRLLLEFFDEKRQQGKREAHREAAVIMPFDPIATFGKMTSLTADGNDEEIFQHTLMLELPNPAQHRFPTAYGLFHTLLDLVSSPQAFAVDWAPNYQRSPVDVQFEKLETKLLGTAQMQKWKNREFSIIPIYFGSVPLFCLVLKFPESFPKDSSSAEVYRSILANLHDQVRVTFDDDFIRNNILSPFINKVMAAEIQKWPEKNLEHLETLLFGVVPAGGDRGTWRGRAGGATNKNWKSWVMTIPSQPIRELPGVQAENTRLWNLWLEEKHRVLMDDERRISHWFEAGRFFEQQGEADGHDYWSCQVHWSRFTAMFRQVGVPIPNTVRNQPAELQRALRDLEKSNYFSRSRGSYLMKYLLRQISELAAISDCPFTPDCSPPPGQRGTCPRHYRVFLDLKAMFCRSRENKGEHMRFSIRRLLATVDAAVEDRCEVPDLDEVNLEPWINADLEGKYWSDFDPTKTIGKLVNQLSDMAGGRHVRSIEFDAAFPRVTIVVGFRGPLSASKGGKSFEHASGTADLLRQRGMILADANLNLDTEVVVSFDAKIHEGTLVFTPGHATDC